MAVFKEGWASERWSPRSLMYSGNSAGREAHFSKRRGAQRSWRLQTAVTWAVPREEAGMAPHRGTGTPARTTPARAGGCCAVLRALFPWQERAASAAPLGCQDTSSFRSLPGAEGVTDISVWQSVYLPPASALLHLAILPLLPLFFH